MLLCVLLRWVANSPQFLLFAYGKSGYDGRFPPPASLARPPCPRLVSALFIIHIFELQTCKLESMLVDYLIFTDTTGI